MDYSLGNLIYKMRPLYKAYSSGMLSLTSRYPIGTNVYERDWDALILLDTCRVDALREVAPEYDFLGEVGKHPSVGSTSSEWIAQTFTKSFLDEINETAYVSGNGWAKEVIENRVTPEEHFGAGYSFSDWNIALPREFKVLDQAWKYEPEPRFDHGLGHPEPRYITDRAISIARNYKLDRLIIHYSQPHAPYTSNAIKEQRDLEPYESEPFDYLRSGGDKEVVWEAYLDHLRFVLDDLELLLNNLAAEDVVISADHGEAFGEWFVYGHGPALFHPHVKIVPWAETTASDSGDYVPETQEQSGGIEVEEQLSAMGYM